MLPVTDDAIMSADHLAALDNFERGIVEHDDRLVVEARR